MPNDKDLSQQFVTLHGVQYSVRSKALVLQNKGIKDLSEIKGLHKLWYLKKLDLSQNQISTMKGLEPLENLKVLKLSHNQIQNIDHITSLKRLQYLLLDNNQLKEFRQADLPIEPIFKKIDISKNPIEKFDIYMTYVYKAIKFGPKEWFPKQEIKRLSKQMKRIQRGGRVKMQSSKEGFMKFLIYFTIWAILAFVLALIVNLPFWGAILSRYGREYWEVLFSDGLWTFLVGGIGAVIIMVVFYEMM